jgi:hypothetical protein
VSSDDIDLVTLDFPSQDNVRLFFTMPSRSCSVIS